jgi:hypothetical protein
MLGKFKFMKDYCEIQKLTESHAHLKVVPSLIGEEEEVLQDTVSLFQMLAIHSSPQLISSFFQDGLVVRYDNQNLKLRWHFNIYVIIFLSSFENMLPEFLVNLGEELNQPIPASLSDIVRSKNSARTPSPTLSSRTLTVHSVSRNETLDSQRSVTLDLR